MLSPELTFTNIHSRWCPDGNLINHEARVIMLNECEQLLASRAAQALDARLTTLVVSPSVSPARLMQL